MAAHSKLKATHSVPYREAASPLLESHHEDMEDDSSQVSHLKRYQGFFQLESCDIIWAIFRNYSQKILAHYPSRLVESSDRSGL